MTTTVTATSRADPANLRPLANEQEPSHLAPAPVVGMSRSGRRGGLLRIEHSGEAPFPRRSLLASPTSSHRNLHLGDRLTLNGGVTLSPRSAAITTVHEALAQNHLGERRPTAFGGQHR